MWLLFWLHDGTVPRKVAQSRYPRQREPLSCESSIVELFQSFREPLQSKELRMSHVCLTDCYQRGTGLPRVAFRGTLISSKQQNWVRGSAPYVILIRFTETGHGSTLEIYVRAPGLASDRQKTRKFLYELQLRLRLLVHKLQSRLARGLTLSILLPFSQYQKDLQNYQGNYAAHDTLATL